VTRVVLDASALLAFLLDEPGAVAVTALLPRAAISAVNHSETLAQLVDRGKPLAEAVAGLARLRVEVVPFDSGSSAVAASLRAASKRLGLSLGDRACLALGLARQLPVVTTDRAWTRFDVGVVVNCVR
jgi:ribonuclease VapC